MQSLLGAILSCVDCEAAGGDLRFSLPFLGSGNSADFDLDSGNQRAERFLIGISVELVLDEIDPSLFIVRERRGVLSGLGQYLQAAFGDCLCGSRAHET